MTYGPVVAGCDSRADPEPHLGVSDSKTVPDVVHQREEQPHLNDDREGDEDVEDLPAEHSGSIPGQPP